MKGYNILFEPMSLETYKEVVPVGCRRCREQWNEEHEFFKHSPRVNGTSYCYDYCDKCKTEHDLSAGSQKGEEK